MFTRTAKEIAADIPNVNVCMGVRLLMFFIFILVFLYFDLGGVIRGFVVRKDNRWNDTKLI